MASSAAPAADPCEVLPAEQTTTTEKEKSSLDNANTNPPSTSTDSTQSQAQKQPSQAAAQDDDDDDDSDFDELDDVLDNFKPTAPKDAAASATTTTTTATGASGDAPPDADADFDEAAFMKQLEKDMANMMGQQSGSASDSAHLADIEQGADAFTKQLEESGIPPGDFIKQLLADVMAEEGVSGADLGAGAAAATGAATAAGAGAAAAASVSAAGGDKKGGAPAPESFNDAIHRTINRMKESGDKATAAASEDDVSDDMLAQLLKAVEAGAGAGEGDGEDGDLMKMFAGLMEQLSNKEMLYEPMKELHIKFGPWLAENKGKVSDEDMSRYELQAGIVSEILTKFEEPGYTDEDSKCREYVWEKMQAMQAAGNPPEELVANPWDDSKGGVPDCPQQ
ncbi:Peroxisome chaperone and import receptor [Aspergillus melleus]|uniref:Peroxisome chaperone and import receptor n=1 Tax=Aspergillus melleus TaxID=138277 RepID=A0ACC3B5P7_9EURO|nr:Peroxisome chaperone and import receptor [Aspergillus melleus]